MDFLDGIEILIEILYEFVFEKAFNKDKILKKRLPYIIIFVLAMTVIIGILTYIGFKLLLSKNIFGYFIVLFDILMFLSLLYPFFKRKK